MGKFGYSKTGGGGRPGGGGAARLDRAPGGGGASGQRKCINWGATDHLTKDCKKAEVPRDKRLCWKCNRPGHLGRDCCNGAPKARGNNGDAAVEIDFFGMTE